VPRAQIDERYFESPYYIIPNDPVGQEALTRRGLPFGQDQAGRVGGRQTA
jgi:hypothetical protein